jgi:hypothetical protein
MSHVFISYSRKDTDFARKLSKGLEDYGKDTWVDWDEIRPSALWWQEILRAIDASDMFIFIISRNSIASEVCQDEIEYAASVGKRMITVLKEEMDASLVPSAIASIQWVSFVPEQDFQKCLKTLIEAINLDLKWDEIHTKILLRARDWEHSNKDSSRELRGLELVQAEKWWDEADPEKGRKVIPTQEEYLLGSRRGAAWRIVKIGFAACLVLLLMTMLMRQLGHGLRTEIAPSGIKSFGMAGSLERANQIIASWGPTGVARAMLFLGMETFYIANYLAAILLGCWYLATSFKRHKRFIATTAFTVAVIAVVGVVSDVVENIALIHLLLGYSDEWWVRVARWSASTKLALTLPGTICAIAALLNALWTLLRRPQDTSSTLAQQGS